MADILPFRPKRLSGFIPDEPEAESAKPPPDQDTAPCEYVAPEQDPA